MIPRVRRTGAVVGVLGAAQTLAWASSYYLPAIVAAPMARDFGIAPSAVFAAFSASLLLTAVLGPAVGRAVDQRGGRGVLLLSNLILAAGLATLALAPSIPILFVGWGLLGLGMALGLYDTAFATLAGLYGRDARRSITGITLIAGFASTVGWPLTAALEAWLGWRGACLGWVALHLVVGLPLHLLLPETPPPPPRAAPAVASADGPGWPALLLLALALAASGFNTTAMSAHLPSLLAAAGATAEAAVLAGALVGPTQVLARVAEWTLLGRAHPLVTGKIAAAASPAAAGVLALGGPPAAFAVVHGVGQGLLTIVRGTLPLALFGARGYGARQGWILAPMRFLQALAPVGFGLVLEGPGSARFGSTRGSASSAWAPSTRSVRSPARAVPIDGRGRPGGPDRCPSLGRRYGRPGRWPSPCRFLLATGAEGRSLPHGS
ncbi:MFS transporter [Roseomonas sp. CCTCC AB2023176]|uniref:MFS transporter n=1 Tax=Roseomonas sp. CCTCC AB2023176 TaxID=3342640 RepID=UPI0035E073C3